jgi:acyl carrier protein
MLLKQDVIDIIKELGISVDINEVKDDTTLKSLGIDSLDVYNLFIELEMKTGRNVSDDDVDKLSTINSIVEYFS